jgi:hypothetical protein
MNVTRTVAVTALAAGLATTGCSATTRQPTTVISVAPTPTPTTSPTGDPAPLPFVDPIDTDTTNGDDPTDTPVQFAIRYLNDLRDGDWSAALGEMAYVERATVDLNDAAAAVGSDVLRNASDGSRHLARCTSGRQFAPEAVILRCGRTNVVVHIETLAGFRGVKVSAMFVGGDHPGIPHTTPTPGLSDDGLFPG